MNLVLPDNNMMFISAVALGAEANAEIIGWCTRALRRSGRPDSVAMASLQALAPRGGAIAAEQILYLRVVADHHPILLQQARS